MKISILNDVLGPILHGPSSSHTAASYSIGRLTNMLCENEIKEICITFDSKGSFAKTYKSQNGDLAFLSGIINLAVDDPDFLNSKDVASEEGIKFTFESKNIPEADHPNYMLINVPAKKLTIVAKSIGGGMVLIESVNKWKVKIKANNYNILIEFLTDSKEKMLNLIQKFSNSPEKLRIQNGEKHSFIHLRNPNRFKDEFVNKLKSLDFISNIWTTHPILFPIHGTPLFKNSFEMLNLAFEKKYSLGKLGLMYESYLLNINEKSILEEMEKRILVMFSSVEKGLEKENSHMNLLKHSASNIKKKETQLFSSGINLRSAYRAMAAMDTASSGGLICAAPTGASCGVIASVLYTLHHDFNIKMNKIIKCAFAAGAIGLINGMNSTFAAEIAGCQVEIGMAGAMAAAAVIEAANGSPTAATDAAAIALQNTMGSVCDLVAGFCEIPCHTRNATVASNAFICADLIIGGYVNPINLDDSIQASFESGKMLPPQLRCTSLGGIAITESAKKLGIK
ncbi:MAG: L-serine ammonia-lyase, iron-sulfur-dependent, subunit alpha [Promethearchaeota archaeon]